LAKICSNQHNYEVIINEVTGFVVVLLCPCGKPQCYACNATSEAACVRQQKLQICHNVEVCRVLNQTALLCVEYN